MTRLMSFWARPTVAANRAVTAPIKVTICLATAAYSNMGDSRQTMIDAGRHHGGGVDQG